MFINRQYSSSNTFTRVQKKKIMFYEISLKSFAYVKNRKTFLYIFFIRIHFHYLGGTVEQNMYFLLKGNLKEIDRSRVKLMDRNQ